MKTRTIVIQVVCLIVAAVLGLFMVLGRSSAQQPKGGAPAGGGGGKVAGKPPVVAAPASASASAAPAEEKKDDHGDKKDDDDPSDPLKYAQVGPQGGVPTHPGYKYKSPFGNPRAKEPIKVQVGMVVNSIDEYDVKAGTFEADFFLSLESPTPMPKIDMTSPNGKIEDKEVLADLPTFKFWRMRGKFKSPPDLRKYPFDSQVLRIELEEDTYGADTLRFYPDPEHIDVNTGFEVLGWDLSYVEARISSHAYPDRFDNDDLYYGRFVYRLGIERYGTSSIFKVYVPALVIVIIGLLAMWVPPDEMEVRSNGGAPMLAGAVLFHFALMQELPATSYLTRADKVMMGVYSSLLLNMISTWWMFLVREENMEVVFRIARIAVPVASVIVMALACVV
jgi:hypothetical protein